MKIWISLAELAYTEFNVGLVIAGPDGGDACCGLFLSVEPRFDADGDFVASLLNEDLVKALRTGPVRAEKYVRAGQ